MDLREMDCDPRDWIALAEDGDQWRAYERVVMNLRVPEAENYMPRFSDSVRYASCFSHFVYIRTALLKGGQWVKFLTSTIFHLEC